jgi:hypothetical protein
MRQPWYWYVFQEEMTGALSVRTQVARPDSVRGSTWVVPMRDWTAGRWNMYLKPWWYAKGIDSGEIDPDEMLNCEWVCVERRRPPHFDCPKSCESCYPPPSETMTCPCCGREEDL